MPAAKKDMGLEDNTEKTKELSTFLASVFNGRICLTESQASESWNKVWSKKHLLLAEKDRVRKHLNKPDTCMSNVPDGMHHKCRQSWLMALKACLSWL